MTDQANIVGVVAEILELSEDEIRLDSSLEELGWDSLSDVTFLSVADSEYHRTIDPPDLALCKTPADLAALLN